MTNEVTDIDLRRNTVRCIWGEDFFTIEKRIGQASVAISLTPEEEDYLYEQLTMKRQPWGDAG